MHGWNEKDAARRYLGGKLNEIESSYWKYLSVWEKDEWEELKETYAEDADASDADILTMSGDDNEE